MPVVIQVEPKICFIYHGHSFYSLKRGLALSQSKRNSNSLILLESQVHRENDS